MEYSLNEIQKTAQLCIENVKYKSVLFYAEMGVGKTTLIKEIVKMLGSKDDVSSPTFSIVNEYEAPNFSIFHFDFYRIHDEEEVYDLGFEDYFNNTKDWQLMEWPELIPNLLPDAFTKIEIELLNNGKRKLKLSNFD